LNYGFHFFRIALEQTYKSELEESKIFAGAMRTALFAKEEDFKKYINRKK